LDSNEPNTLMPIKVSDDFLTKVLRCIIILL
jgi:hypothetical protein